MKVRSKEERAMFTERIVNGASVGPKRCQWCYLYVVVNHV